MSVYKLYSCCSQSLESLIQLPSNSQVYQVDDISHMPLTAL